MSDSILTFGNPPIRETVLAAGFHPIPGFTAAHLGMFWSKIADEYSVAHELPRYDMPIERTGSADSAGGGFSVHLGGPPTRPRVLLHRSDGTGVCQVQSDWFAFGWRRGGPQTDYPRYGASRGEFAELFRRFADFVREELGQELQLLQAEVSYINEVRSNWRDAHRVFRLLNSPEEAGAADMETVSFQVTKPLVLGQQESGRLYAKAYPESREGSEFLIFDLTARGRPLDGSLDGVLSLLDLGRRAIVLNFKALTTDEQHMNWGLS